MFGGDGLPFGRHSDVLNASPADADELARLIEELKRRGNAAFSQKAFEEAEALYSKAIEVNGSDPLKNQHIFYANRSASRTSMGKSVLAVEDADACIALAVDYAKGYFRKAQALKALKKYKEALGVVQTATTLEPENKSLVTLAKQLEELAKSYVEQAPAVTTPAQKKVVTRVDVVKETTRPTTSEDKVVVADDEEIVGHVRGYKKTADGRTTTFFNNELTEEAKRLIGDIAPKKVDDPNKVQIKSVEGGSAWNVGNTFEEKDMNAWAKAKIESLLADVSTPLSGSDASSLVRVTEVKDVAGDASIAVVRGKKRYIFDFSFSLAVVGELNDAEVVGELKFLDVSSDADGDYDVDVVVPSRYASDVGKVLHTALSSSSSRFRTRVAKQLAAFVKEYQAF